MHVRSYCSTAQHWLRTFLRVATRSTAQPRRSMVSRPGCRVFSSAHLAYALLRLRPRRHGMRYKSINNAVTIASIFTVLGPLAACIPEGGEVLTIMNNSDAGKSDRTGELSSYATDFLTTVGSECTTTDDSIVRCGSSICTRDTQACCLDAYAGTATCIDKDVFCGTPTSTGAPATCDEQSDCPKGQSCCWHTAVGYLSILCMPDSECPGDSLFVSNRVLCASPAEQRACAPHETCTPLFGAIPSWWSACM